MLLLVDSEIIEPDRPLVKRNCSGNGRSARHFEGLVVGVFALVPFCIPLPLIFGGLCLDFREKPAHF